MLSHGFLAILGCSVAGLLAAAPGVATPGELDSSFGRMGEFALQTNPACNDGCPERFGSYAEALTLQADGKLLIAGQNFEQAFYSQGYTEGSKNVIVRLNSDGTLDGTFGSGGYAQTPALKVLSLYANADGSITSVGSKPPDRLGEAVDIEHYTASGATVGAVQWLAAPILAKTAQIDSKGRLVVLTEGSQPEIVRFLPTGALDRSFRVGRANALGARKLVAPSETEIEPYGPEAVALAKDGSVFVAATTYDPMHFDSGNEPLKIHTVLYHFTSSGKPDRFFGRGGMVALPASKGYASLMLAIAPDDDVVLAAGEDITGSIQQVHLQVVRYTKNGRPDDSFGSGGVATRAWYSISPDLVPTAIAFDASGDTVIAGTNTFTPNSGSVGKWFLTRLTNGGFDCSFGSRGLVLGAMGTGANAVAVQTNGRIVIAGKRNHELVTARYMGGGTPRTCPGQHKSHKPKHRRKRRRHR